MPVPGEDNRVWPILLMAGGAILVTRAMVLIGGGSTERFVSWLAFLTWVELALAVAACASAAVWAWRPEPANVTRTLKVAASLTLLHAIRVAVFVVGRIGPFRDFDVRPEWRADHAGTWTWGEVWFAGLAAALSLVVLVAVWRYRRAKRT